jgi:hypothetical protein
MNKPTRTREEPISVNITRETWKNGDDIGANGYKLIGKEILRLSENVKGSIASRIGNVSMPINVSGIRKIRTLNLFKKGNLSGKEKTCQPFLSL